MPRLISAVLLFLAAIGVAQAQPQVTSFTYSPASPVEPAWMTLNATATFTHPLNKRVVFSCNNGHFFDDTQPPYTTSFSANRGTHTCSAYATDANGDVSPTVQVTFTVAPPPTPPSLTSGQTTGANHLSIRLTGANFAADAYVKSGPDANVAGTQYSGAQLTREGSTALTFAVHTNDQWQLINHGLHFAVVNPGTGLQSGVVYVQRTYNAAPTVSFVSPANGSSHAHQAAFWVEASPSDIDGSINRVELWHNGSRFGNATLPPYRGLFTANLAGNNQTITAIVYDNRGATGTANLTIHVAQPVGSINATPNPCLIRSDATTCNSTIAWTAQPTDTTVWVRPPSGAHYSIGAGTSGSVALAVTSSNHTVELRSGANVFAPITVSGVANTPPTVSMTAPTQGATYTSGNTITLTANASDSNAGDAISRVDFYRGAELLATDTASPYTFAYLGAEPGSHTFSARAYDSYAGSTTSASVTVSANALQQPYLGTVRNVPGRIQAEDFDAGGQTVSYFDSTMPNEGARYRTGQRVDIRDSIDAGGGYDVGWITTGEWLEYTVNATQTGSYNVALRVGSAVGGAALHLEVDGVAVPGAVAVPNTGSEMSYATVVKAGVVLAQGTRVIRVYADQGGYAINWFEVRANTAPSAAWVSPAENAEYSTNAGIPLRVTASDADEGDDVARVEFRRGVTLIATATTRDGQGQFAHNDSVAVEGDYSYSATPYDRNNLAGAAVTRNVRVKAPQWPYIADQALPGTLEAENFDHGGNNVAYRDDTDGNAGGVYRTGERVDIRAANGGHEVFQMTAGEWLEYTVDVAAGSYKFGARVGADTAGATFHILLDGVDVSGTLTVPATGATATADVFRTGQATLTARNDAVLRLVALSGTLRVDRIFASPNALPTAVLVAPLPNATFAVGARVRIIGSGGDAEGPLQKVEFWSSVAGKLGEKTAAPFEFDWTPTAAGDVDLSIKAFDADGASTTSAVRRVQIIAAQRPYPHPTLRQAPTLIEAEHYDEGGQGVAYNDLDYGNTGAPLGRDDDVETAPCEDDELGCGGFVHLAAGEWLEYTFLGPQDPGPLGLEIRTNTDAPGDALEISLNGQLQTALGPMPDANDEYSGGPWRSIHRWPLSLQTEQTYVLRVHAKLGLRINYLSIAANEAPNVSIHRPQAGETVRGGRFSAWVQEEPFQFDRIEFFLDEGNTGTFPSAPWRVGRGDIRFPIEVPPTPEWVPPAASDVVHRLKAVAYDRYRAFRDSSIVTFHTTDRTGSISASDCTLVGDQLACDIPVSWTSNIVDPPGTASQLRLFRRDDAVGTQIGTGANGSTSIHLELRDRVELKLIQPRGAVVARATVSACQNTPLTLSIADTEVGVAEPMHWGLNAGCVASNMHSVHLKRRKIGSTTVQEVYRADADQGTRGIWFPIEGNLTHTSVGDGYYVYWGESDLDLPISNEITVKVGDPGAMPKLLLDYEAPDGLEVNRVVTFEAEPEALSGLENVRFELSSTSSFAQISEICEPDQTAPCPDLEEPYTRSYRLPAASKFVRAVGTKLGEPYISEPVRIGPTSADSETPHVEPIPAIDVASDEVGTTAGTFRVDESGAATYTIPLMLPAGGGGLTPQLSLDYSSRGGPGFMGTGWAVGGLSTISRCRRNREFGDPATFDDVVRDYAYPALLSSDDAYCLDGQRLLERPEPCTEQQGCQPRVCPVGQVEMRTEIDSQAIVCGTRDGAEFDVFTVESRDGTVREYGAGSGGKVYANLLGEPTTQPFAWQLNRIRDRNGNYADFSYRADESVLYAGQRAGVRPLAHVAYSGRVGAAPRATHACVVFDYADQRLADGLVREDYVTGHRIELARSVERIGVYADVATCPANVTDTDPGLVRTYALGYTVDSGASEQRLSSIKECGYGPGGTRACYPATTFSGPTGVGFINGGATGKWSYTTDLANAMVDYKVGDVSGDGVPDLVWLKHMACFENGGRSDFRIMVSRSTGWQLENPETQDAVKFDGVNGGCREKADQQSARWFLYDFNGDSRDDLLATTVDQASVTAWRIHLNQNGAFAASGIATGLPMAAASVPGDEDGARVMAKLADFNGDGLPDVLLREASDALRIHYLVKDTTGQLAYRFEPSAIHRVVLEGAASESVNASPPKSAETADFDGDGRADLIVRTSTSWVAYTSRQMERVAGERVHRFARLGDVATVDQDAGSREGDVQPVDLNGDGLTDLVLRRKVNGSATSDIEWRYRLNRGRTVGTNGQFTTSVLVHRGTDPQTRSVELLDVTGDGRVDFVFASGAASTLATKAYVWTRNGFAATAVDVNGGYELPDPSLSVGVAIDSSGDGRPELMRFSRADGTGNTYTAQGQSRPAMVQAITNGLDAKTQVFYSSIGDQRVENTHLLDYGRGSPVFGVGASLSAVRYVYTPAPMGTDTGALDADHAARIEYRYSGGRVQAGGRGSLGFATVTTITKATDGSSAAATAPLDVQTTTAYLQGFPFIGRPSATEVRLGAEPIEGDIPRVLSDSTTDWIEFKTPGDVAALTSRLVVARQIEQQTYDLATAEAEVHTTPSVVSRVVTDFEYDLDGMVQGHRDPHAYGNVTLTRVRTYDGAAALLETKTTTNVYGCTVSPPSIDGCSQATNLNAEHRRLGRLSISTTQATRGGSTTTRRASFEYDSTTLQLVSEIVGPYTGHEVSPYSRAEVEMRTDHEINASGLRTRTVTCDVTSFPTRAMCLNLGDFEQRQWPDSPLKFKRFSEVTYDASDRYVDSKSTPFFNDQLTGDFEMLATETVETRTAWGAPERVTDVHGTASDARYGPLGREQFRRSAIGSFAKTTYRWCTSRGVTPGATCPEDASYRVTVTATTAQGAVAAAPSSWTYFDRLGREVLRISSLYQASDQSQSRYSAVRTHYDALGRAFAVTNPYFATGPDTLAPGTPTSGVETVWTQTYRDQIGRIERVVAPASMSNALFTGEHTVETSFVHSGLATQRSAPRRFAAEASMVQTGIERRNALGEVRQTLEDPDDGPNATGQWIVHKDYGPFGVLEAVRRTPRAASGAQTTSEIATTIEYDVAGRKRAVNDPDKGRWTYVVNALGETVQQSDAKGQLTTFRFDALGRVLDRQGTNASGQVDDHARFEYDRFVVPQIEGCALSTPGALLREDSGPASLLWREHCHDSFGRPIESVSVFTTQKYYARTGYDRFGRVRLSIDPASSHGSIEGARMIYDGGFLVRVEEAHVADDIYFELLGTDPAGRPRFERLGGHEVLKTTRQFDPRTGELTSLFTNSGINFQSWQYAFDTAGNLRKRVDNQPSQAITEKFEYDTRDRLLSARRVVGGVETTQNVWAYDDLGNMLSKQNASGATSSYAYCGTGPSCAQPHAVKSVGATSYNYDSNGNLVTERRDGADQRSFDYSSFDAVTRIRRLGQAAPNEARFRYGPDRARWIRLDGASSGDNLLIDEATHYVGNVEFTLNASGQITARKRYIGTRVIVTHPGNTSTSRRDFLLRDGLNSVDAIVAESDTGELTLTRYSYNAFGERRLADGPDAWRLLTVAESLAAATTTRRGFTGHEMVDSVGIVHMNGRIYDPALGRFLQADPFVDAGPQGLNRYSYVLNNPLGFVDPSGYGASESWGRYIPMFVGTMFAVVSGGYSATLGVSWAGFGYAVGGAFVAGTISSGGNTKAGLQSAFTAGITFGVGYALGQSSTYSSLGATGQRAVLAVTDGVLAEIQGGNFGHAFARSFLASTWDAQGIDDPVIQALAGGTISAATGGKFANGATTSLLAWAMRKAEAQATDRRMEAAAAFDPDTALAQADVILMPRIGHDYAAAMRMTPAADELLVVAHGPEDMPGYAADARPWPAATQYLDAEQLRFEIIAARRWGDPRITKIRLIICYAGKGNANLASDLSNVFPTFTVIASDGLIEGETPVPPATWRTFGPRN